MSMNLKEMTDDQLADLAVEVRDERRERQEAANKARYAGFVGYYLMDKTSDRTVVSMVTGLDQLGYPQGVVVIKRWDGNVELDTNGLVCTEDAVQITKEQFEAEVDSIVTTAKAQALARAFQGDGNGK